MSDSSDKREFMVTTIPQYGYDIITHIILYIYPTYKTPSIVWTV